MIQFSGNISKNFTQREYHPGTTTVYYTVNTSTFVRCLQQFRNWLKRPMIVVSFFRTKAENIRVGGIPTSNHLTGTACDFKLNGKTIDQATFITWAKKWNEITRANGCVGEAGFYDAGWVHFGMQNHNQAVANNYKFVHWHTLKNGKQINNPYPELRGL